MDKQFNIILELINTNDELIKNYNVSIANKIEYEISKLQSDKNQYIELYSFLKENQSDYFSENSLSRYISFKISELFFYKNTTLNQQSLEQIYSLVQKSKFERLFNHYIRTKLYLDKNSLKYISNDILENTFVKAQLASIGWSNKKNLYQSAIEEIVKFKKEKSYASVILISNKNEHQVIDTLLELKKQQKQNKFKIIFISNNKSNATNKLISLVDSFIQLNNDYGCPMPRNIGTVFANSEIIIFVDDDGIPADDMIQQHVKLHKENEKIIATRGACLPLNNNIAPQHYWLGNQQRVNKINLEGNSSFKSSAFYKVGGWGDYILFSYEGTELCYRLILQGIKTKQFIYSPKPVLYHDYIQKDRDIDNKKQVLYTMWQLLKYNNDNFHNINNIFSEGFSC